MTAQGARQVLRERFGFRDFRPGQQPVIEAAAAGRDVLAVMATGAGKSLTYQVPALLDGGTTVVVSPLIALMRDQVEALRSRNIAAAMLASNLESGEQARVLSDLPELKLVYVAPERLVNDRFRQTLRRIKLARIVVDEAHCVSEWGHDFRPDYRSIGLLRTHFARVPIMALTATATPAVQQDICRSLGMTRPVTIVTGFDRPNLTYRVWPVVAQIAKRRLIKRVVELERGPGIIYVGTRKEAETVAADLQRWGNRASHYHGGRHHAERAAVQEAFMRGGLNVIVATNAFGMGIDKANVRFVLHQRMPSTLEAYFQEAGRAGRDGQEATCTLISAPGDEALHRYLIERSMPSVLDLKRLYLYLRNAADERAFSLSVLARRMALPAGRLKSACRELARQGIIIYDEATTASAPTILPPYHKQVPDFDGSYLRRLQAHRLELLAHMAAYADAGACRRRRLLAYFGDESGVIRCRCDVCDPDNRRPLSADDFAVLRELEKRPQRARGLGRRLGGVLPDWTANDLELLVHELTQRRLLAVDNKAYTLSQYGRRVLRGEALRPPPGEKPSQDLQAQCLRLLDEGVTPTALAARIGVSRERVDALLISAVKEGKLASYRLVDPQAQARIADAVDRHGTSRLRRLKDALPDVSELEIKVALIAGDAK